VESAFRKKNCDDQRELDLASGCLSASCCSSPPQYAGSLADEEQQRTLRQDLAYRKGPELVVGFRAGHCCSSHCPDLPHGQLLSTGNSHWPGPSACGVGRYHCLVKFVTAEPTHTSEEPWAYGRRRCQQLKVSECLLLFYGLNAQLCAGNTGVRPGRSQISSQKAK